eukprot:m.74040 g.74040  ORF g.74040 m.74040 type:complete len:98 (-) comp17072_c0_seq3:28-321(-)
MGRSFRGESHPLHHIRIHPTLFFICCSFVFQIKALAHVCERPIEVYQAHSPRQTVGDALSGTPIRLSFHQKQYGLGEHYNAVMPASSTEEGGAAEED